MTSTHNWITDAINEKILKEITNMADELQRISNIADKNDIIIPKIKTLIASLRDEIAVLKARGGIDAASVPSDIPAHLILGFNPVFQPVPPLL